MKLCCLCVLSFGLAVPIAPLRGRSPSQAPVAAARPIHVFWEVGFAAAQARAKRLQRPIVFALLGAKDGASRRLLKQVYTAREVRSLLAEVVPIVGCADAVPAIEAGPRKGTSTLFPGVLVAEHQANAKLAAQRYVGDPVLVPQHLMIAPDGHLLERHQGFLDAKGLARLLTGAIGSVDPSWRTRPRGAAESGAAESGGTESGNTESEQSWSALFEGDDKQRAATVSRLVKSADKDRVLRLFTQIRDPDTRRLVLEHARRGDMSWVGPLVTAALTDGDDRVRIEALLTAGASGLGTLLPTILDNYRREDSAATRRTFLAALGACAKGDKKALATIALAAKDRDERTRVAAYLALTIAGTHAPETAKRVGETLVKRGLKDRNVNVRGAAAWGLGELRLKTARAAITKLLGRHRRKQRRVFEAAIERIDGHDPKDWDKLRRRTERSRR